MVDWRTRSLDPHRDLGTKLTAELQIGETLTMQFHPVRLATTGVLVASLYWLGSCSVLFSADNADVGDDAQGPRDAQGNPDAAVDATSPDASTNAAVCLDGNCYASATVLNGQEDVSQDLASDTLVFDDTEIELGDANGNGNADELVGLRFQNLDIPKGAEILGAEIAFTAASDDVDTDIVILRFQESAMAAPFSSTNLLEGRATLNGLNATWNLQSPSGDWERDERGLPQRTLNFIGAMQALVNLENWKRGDNAIVVLVRGMLGVRVVKAYESGPANAATIFVQYSDPAMNDAGI